MADVDVSTVATRVATIITAYRDGLDLLNRLKDERADKHAANSKALDELTSSLTQGPIIYTRGDPVVREQLKEIIINLQMTLLTNLRISLANDTIEIELDALRAASDNNRVDSSMALCQLSQRLASTVTTPAPPPPQGPMRLKSMPLMIDSSRRPAQRNNPPQPSGSSSSSIISKQNREGVWPLFPSTSTTRTLGTLEAAASSCVSICSSVSSDILPPSMTPLIAVCDSGVSSPSPPQSQCHTQSPSPSVLNPMIADLTSLGHFHPAYRPEREQGMCEQQLQLPEMPRSIPDFLPPLGGVDTSIRGDGDH
ncbi:hypothetical protein BGW36DRAFT_432915 [Talaromyces proteolyticus]|uniref:Uncharacterized protein n=1 Tax=Talaromyces proteolyticus TaxID=1131652 RepID=A0AAD4PRW4_9EURO|nr:uncharacterized protein BGW36DRAFT_432915 [Talaromyces proteolyticus]KAH8689950.1 hypothetical protein BGW36DRAFT_432915 [Talaromyces proteolyticus]